MSKKPSETAPEVVTMNFQIDKLHKAAFAKIARDRDLTASQMLRAFVVQTINEAPKQEEMFRK